MLSMSLFNNLPKERKPVGSKSRLTWPNELWLDSKFWDWTLLIPEVTDERIFEYLTQHDFTVMCSMASFRNSALEMTFLERIDELLAIESFIDGWTYNSTHTTIVFCFKNDQDALRFTLFFGP